VNDGAQNHVRTVHSSRIPSSLCTFSQLTKIGIYQNWEKQE